MPHSTCFFTHSATALFTRFAYDSSSQEPPVTFAFIRSSRSFGRGRLPTWVVRMRSALTGARRRALGPGNVQLDGNVVARGVRVRADLLVRLAGERRELGLRQAPVLHAELHREAESAALARADGDGAGDPRLRGVFLVLLADEIERAAEARRVARGEQVLGRRRAGLARAAHFLGHREAGLHRAVARLGVAVSPAGGGRRRGEKGLDRVHSDLRKEKRARGGVAEFTSPGHVTPRSGEL